MNSDKHQSSEQRGQDGGWKVCKGAHLLFFTHTLCMSYVIAMFLLKGLDWLNIHLVTLHGAKKKSLFNSPKYVMQEPLILIEYTDVILQGQGWWKTADDPWQTLATSMEIVDAIRSPDPSQFVSHQPVHQDGSCNGLQHYAALGHDSYGAKQVNLMPSERPQDVYLEVQYWTSSSAFKGATS